MFPSLLDASRNHAPHTKERARGGGGWDATTTTTARRRNPQLLQHVRLATSPRVVSGHSTLANRERPALRTELRTLLDTYEKGMQGAAAVGGGGNLHPQRTQKHRNAPFGSSTTGGAGHVALPPNYPTAAEKLHNTSEIRNACMKLNVMLDALSGEEARDPLSYDLVKEKEKSDGMNGYSLAGGGGNDDTEDEDEEDDLIPLFVPVSTAESLEAQLYAPLLPPPAHRGAVGTIIASPHGNTMLSSPVEETTMMMGSTAPQGLPLNSNTMSGANHAPHPSNAHSDNASVDSQDYDEPPTLENGPMLNNDTLIKAVQKDLAKLKASLDVTVGEVKRACTSNTSAHGYRAVRHCRRMRHCYQHLQLIVHAMLHRNLLEAEMTMTGPEAMTMMKDIMSNGAREVQGLRRTVRDLEYEVEQLRMQLAHGLSEPSGLRASIAGHTNSRNKHRESTNPTTALPLPKSQQHMEVLSSVLASPVQELPYMAGMSQKELFVLDHLCWKLEKCMLAGGIAPGVDNDYLLRINREHRLALAAIKAVSLNGGNSRTVDA